MKRLGPGPTLGAVLVTLFLLAALLGPAIAPYSPTAQRFRILEHPSAAHWLGTDQNGCDLLSQVLHGARLAAGISLAVVAISLAIGTTVGAVAGYSGGLVDDALMRLCDILLAFPGILLNIALVALVRRPGIAHLIFALAVNGWVGYARVARGQALALREREFVQAARSLGAPAWRIVLRHIVPNLLGPLIVQATAGFAGVILTEATLAFLGIGQAAPYSWGALLDQGTTFLWLTQHIAIAAGLCIAIVVLGFNLLGDGLRDRLDPKSS